MFVRSGFAAIDAIFMEIDALLSFIEEHLGERNDRVADVEVAGIPSSATKG
jgi:hypothetical protein